MIPLTVPPVRQSGRGTGGAGMFPHTPNLPNTSAPSIQASSSSTVASGPSAPLLTKRIMGIAGALLFYMCASISLTMFNKWLFADAPASTTTAALKRSSSPPYDTDTTAGGSHLPSADGDGGGGGDADDEWPSSLSPYEKSRVTRPPAVMPNKHMTMYTTTTKPQTTSTTKPQKSLLPYQDGYLQSIKPLSGTATTTASTTAPSTRHTSPSPVPTTTFFSDPTSTVVSSIPIKVRSAWTSQYGFQFPLTVTCVHQFLVFLLAVVINRTKVLKGYLGEVERSPMAFRALVPLGIISGVDWGLSNTSLRYVPLSLYEIIKASSPVIVLVLSLLTGTTRPSWRITGIVLLITVGMLLSVSGGDAHVLSRDGFPALGFTCLVVASVLSALRVVYTQIMLHTGGGGGIQCCPPQKMAAPPPLLHLSSDSHNGGTNNSNNNSKCNNNNNNTATTPSPNPRYVVSRVPPEGGGDTHNEDRVQMRGIGGAGQAVYNSISMLVEHRRYMSSETRHGASVNQLDRLEEECGGNGSADAVIAIESHPLVIRTASSSLPRADDHTGVNMAETSGQSNSNNNNNTMGTNTLSSNSLHHLTSQQHQQHQQPTFTNPNRPFNMLTVLYYSAPASCVVLIIPALFFEGGRLYTTWDAYPSHTRTEISALIISTSIIAFLLAISEFLVTILTSALTLCITGIAKQVLIIGLAMVVFGDRITLWSSVGFALSVVGIGMYNYDKLHGFSAPSSTNTATSPNANNANNNGSVPNTSACISPNSVVTIGGSDNGHKTPQALSSMPSPVNTNPS